MSGAEGEGGGSFLSRWSRRKRAALAVPPVAQVPSEATPPDAAPPGAVTPDAEAPSTGAEPAFDLASLPSLESLTLDSDFALFLRKEVPAALRNAALRRAWSLDLSIRDFTGPADYAWDFNAVGSMPGFSLDLPSDVEGLLAQITGPPAPKPEEASEAGEEAQPPAIKHVASSTPLEAVPFEKATEAAPAPVKTVERDEEPATLAALPLEMPQSLPPRRRHGGALPT